MQNITLLPIKKINGEINLPGSKSLSNRALLLAALATGKTTITNLLDSDDVAYMLNALRALNIDFQLSCDKTTCIIEGNAGAFSQTESLELFLGNAGTAMRPLCSILSLCQGSFILTGEERMYERPIGHLVSALIQGGAKIDYLQNKNYPPLKIEGGHFNGGKLSLDGTISSQFLTSLLMMAPLAPNDTIIKIKGTLVSKPYIDITLNIIQKFGVSISHNNYQEFIIKGKQSYISPNHYSIEGDASSASYFLAAAAIKGGSVIVNGIGRDSIQGDTQFAYALEKMGAKIEWGENFIKASRKELNGIDMDFNHIPDAAMTIATTAIFASGPTTIRNIYNWRVKETDRISAMACELKKLGVKVEEGRDYLKIYPKKQLKPCSIDTYNDHRMAMCFALAALGDSPITINDPQCTAKTFPKFFNEFEKLSNH